MEKYGRAGQATDGNITRRMRFACWITKATVLHSEYVILVASPQQQWSSERASMLGYTYSTVHCLSCYNRDGECAVRGTIQGSNVRL